MGWGKGIWNGGNDLSKSQRQWILAYIWRIMGINFIWQDYEVYEGRSGDEFGRVVCGGWVKEVDYVVIEDVIVVRKNFIKFFIRVFLGILMSRIKMIFYGRVLQ